MADRLSPGQEASTRTDAELLQAVATLRDQNAFEEFLSRHSDVAYAVAKQVTRSPDLASDVVQESMLQIWRCAKDFRPGNARTWLLSIVVHRGYNTVRKQKRLQRRHHASREQELERLDRASQAAARPGQAEYLPALSQALGSLSLEERSMVALYFGANLSQAQIGRELGVSQRTVSERLRVALKTLKEQLASAGHAAAAAALEPALASYFASAAPAPGDLCPAVLARIHHPPRRTFRVLSSSLALLVALAAGGIGWGLWRDPPSGTAVHLPTAVASGSDATLDHTGVLKWSFNRPGETEGLKLELGGGARWQAAGGVAGSPYLAFSESGNVVLPSLKGRFPFLVTINFKTNYIIGPFEPQYMSCQLHPTRPFVSHAFDHRCRVPFLAGPAWHSVAYSACCRRPSCVPFPAGPAWHSVRYFVTADSIDEWFGDLHADLIFVKTGGGNRDLLIAFSGVEGIDELEISPIPSSTAPDLERYRSALSAQLAQEPAAPVVLPLANIPSSRPALKTQLLTNLEHPGFEGRAQPQSWLAKEKEQNFADFDRPERLDLVIEGGAWHWADALETGASGALALSAKGPKILLEGWAAKPPVRITFRFKLLAFQRGQVLSNWPVRADWLKFNLRAVFQFPGEFVDLKAGQWMTFSATVRDRRICQYIDGKRLGIAYFPKQLFPVIALTICHPMLIDDLKVEPLAADELPQDSAFWEALKRIPENSVQGEFHVPEIPSGLPGKQVLLYYVRP